MNWKSLTFSLLLSTVVCSGWARTRSNDTTFYATPLDTVVVIDSIRAERLAYQLYRERVARAKRRWLRAVPNIATIQYAGDIGFAAVGIGWDYGKNDRWETHIQLGFLPKWSNDHANLTFTLRENLVPWSIGLGSRRWEDKNARRPGQPLPWSRLAIASVEPVVFTMFLNTIFDDDFWLHEPDKYGGSYYRFSSKIRVHLGVGSRLSYNIPRNRRKHFDRISLYYQLTTYDLAIISAIPNKSLTLGDILCLGVGLQYKFW